MHTHAFRATRSELRTSATILAIMMFFSYFADDTRMHLGNMSKAYTNFSELAK